MSTGDGAASEGHILAHVYSAVTYYLYHRPEVAE
jgi:hypothetical protein